MNKELNSIKLIKMLIDSKSWELRYSGKPFEDMLHVDGWRYFTDCACVCFRRNNDQDTEYSPHLFIWPLIAILGAINTWRVRRL